MQLRSFVRTCSVVGCGALVLMGAGCRGGGRPPMPTPAADPTAIFGDPSAPAPRRADPADSSSPTGVACNHEYYPLRLGYHIQYKTSFPPIGGKTTGYYALRVAEVKPDSVYIKATYAADGEPITSDIIYKCSGGSLQAAGYIDVSSLARGPAYENQYKVRTDAATGQFLPPRISRGDSWSAGFTAKITPLQDATGGESRVIREPITMPIEIRRTALGVERVTVPAGTFEAMKIKTETLFDGNPTISGTEWWVKEVGMVKSTYNAGSGSEDIVTVARGVTVPGYVDIPSPDAE